MRTYIVLFAILLLSWWVVAPLVQQSGFFPIHDDTQVARVFELAAALRDGQFPVRWVADLGYGFGYPLFNFYSPLPYYVGGIGSVLGLSALPATKLMIGIGAVLAGLTMYLLARHFFGRLWALLPAILYLYAPYHAVQIYVRGAVAEIWAYAMIPLVAYTLYRAYDTAQYRWIALAGGSFALLILSHNITALISALFLLLWFIGYILRWLMIRKRSFRRVFAPVAAVALGAALAGTFWLPALAEVSLTKALRLATEVDFRDHFVFADQLWHSPWGFAGSAPGRADGMSFQLGKAHIIVGMIGFLALLSRSILAKLRTSRIVYLTVVTTVTVTLSVLMTLEISQPAWELITPLAFVQFPWRFLVFILTGVSFAAAGIGLFAQKANRYVQILLVVLAVSSVLFFNTKHFQPQQQLTVDTQFYTRLSRLQWETSRISDEYLPKNFVVPQSQTEIPDEKISASDAIMVRQSKHRSNRISFTATAQTAGEVFVALAHFPGWRAFVDGQAVSLRVEQSAVAVHIPAGSHRVELVFGNTPIRSVANSLSIGGIVVFVIALVYGKKKIA